MNKKEMFNIPNAEYYRSVKKQQEIGEIATKGVVELENEKAEKELMVRENTTEQNCQNFEKIEKEHKMNIYEKADQFFETIYNRIDDGSLTSSNYDMFLDELMEFKVQFLKERDTIDGGPAQTYLIRIKNIEETLEYEKSLQGYSIIE